MSVLSVRVGWTVSERMALLLLLMGKGVGRMEDERSRKPRACLVVHTNTRDDVRRSVSVN